MLSDGTITWRLVDRGKRLRSVRLLQEIGVPGRLRFRHAGGEWRLSLPVPDVDRMEYLFEVEDANGKRMTITDPLNPRRVSGAFGAKSEVLLPGYVEPEWLSWPAAEGESEPFELAAPGLDGEGVLGGVLWAAPSLSDREPAPLLLVHDGPEYAELGGLLRYVASAVATHRIPPLRAALLAPGNRNVWYSANPAYADALAAYAELPPATARIGVGVSLGALAMLHAHGRHPGLVDGLMLQSGSYFTAETDPQEEKFSGYAAVSGLVGELDRQASRSVPADASGRLRPVPVVLTCGTAEENLANNRRMAETLRRLGHPVCMVEVRDAHNYTAWRDALHPQLAGLVTELAGERAA